MSNICIFTSTRAEWGLLKRVAELIRNADQLRLKLLVSGSHLSNKYGLTIREIEADGFTADQCVDILKFDDTPPGICNSMGLALSGYGAALQRINPDLLLILGDRYEAFCAAAAAQIHRVPIAHIHGGETTEGAIDEAFRHSITKMAHLHFACCIEYRNRIIQLGENPQRVFNVGALGIENIRKTALMGREELALSLNFNLDRPFFLVTFHPVTLEKNSSKEQIDILLSALENFPAYNIIFTKANADTDGQSINERINCFVKKFQHRCIFVPSLGLKRYLSAMELCSAVIGNSSSGIIEAPLFKVPTVNIGDRQKGRVRPHSVIDCETISTAIIAALKKALTPEFRYSLLEMIHPCEQENTAAKIVEILNSTDLNYLLKKTFYNLENSSDA